MTAIDRLSLERRVDALFAHLMRDASPGAVIGVMQDGEILLRKGYGLANVEHRVPITPATRFRIASVTKQFTVSAALMLADEGRLSLDEPPHRYLPELPPLDVTLDQMMRNSSGLPDFLELLRLGGHGLDRPCRAEDLLAAACRNTHLNFAPGSRFLYSNTNFLLLGLIVERVTGRKLGDVLAERIFVPLGMTRTLLNASLDTPVPDLATGYLANADGSVRRAPHAYPQGGEGGMVSTVEDLLIWSRHYDRPVLKPADLAQRLTTPMPLHGGAANNYLRGVERGSLRGLATIGHGGLWPGYRTEFLRVPDARLSVVVIANLGSVDPHRVARAAAVEALRDAGVLLATPAPVTAAAIEPMAGTYFNADELSLFDLAWRDGEATVTQSGIPFPLAPRGDGWLVADRGAFEFALRLPGAGDTLDVALGAGRVLPFRRLAQREPVPANLSGRYHAADCAATWTIGATADGFAAAVSGPLVTGGPAWPVRGVTRDVVEIETPSPWLTITQLARVERDASGKVSGLTVSSGRIRGMRFARTG
ncbi:MAG: serine hydrolase [Alphaproteobacteria bacterium]|nr:serine hydrolase [Alphaproteobacteria bacterium]